mgnify:FL=1
MSLQSICYGFVKSRLLTMYFCEFVSLMGVGPRWGQRLQYAKILKAPCERLETVWFLLPTRAYLF